MVTGRIHSIETFGTVDGPGIRFVLFMQGCALQCMYCHNPDSWDPSAGKPMTVEQILAEIEPYLTYYQSSGGGITITGGEPSLQPGFVAKVFQECHKRWNLHTALDSSGFNDAEHIKELLDATDLVLLDLKQIDREKHIKLTSQPNDRILAFARWLSDHGKKMWVRHVLVPGINDDHEDLYRLGQFIGTLKTVEKLEILPYHKMGVYKWEQLGRVYPLEGVPTPDDKEVERAYAIIHEGREEATAKTAL
jgi:pyruvate formate lyase activating enzyme